MKLDKFLVLKYLLFSIMLSSTFIDAQVGYVDVEDKIYTFLSRMQTVGVISDYNGYELPKTRKEISKHLITIFTNSDKLDVIDNNNLHDFLTEYEIELSSTFYKSSSLFPNFDPGHFSNEKEKYLYKYYSKNGNSIFVNFIGQLDQLSNTNLKTNDNLNSLLYRFGGIFRGTFWNRIGFSLKSTNGSFLGNKDLARTYSSLKYSYKFHLNSEENKGNNFFDETSSFLTYQNEFAKIKIGNDRKLIGHGPQKILLSDNAPRMDYISLDLNYKIFRFSFFHGKLLGDKSFSFDPTQGSSNMVVDKYIAYHRFALNISKHLNIALGEMIIYANRNVDFAYINPFNFYKSAEHANQDRDNSFLFFDLQNNSIKNIKLYSTILIDDIDFGKIGSGWYGNQTLFSFGLYTTQLYGIFPLEAEFQFVKIDPYVFTHRLRNNNFTNSDFGLGTELQPNSSYSSIKFYYRPHHRINITAGFSYTLHGANELDENGKILTNNGGDILLGHRTFDSEEVYFLSGEREISRDYLLGATVEPINNFMIDLKIKYSNNSLARSQHNEELFTTFSVYSKF